MSLLFTIRKVIANKVDLGWYQLLVAEHAAIDPGTDSYYEQDLFRRLLGAPTPLGKRHSF